MSGCPIDQIIILGSFLLMCWASLRFSDCQRISLKQMVLSPSEVRGVVWRSKASVGGIAFALISSGLLSVGDHNWLWKIFFTLDGFLRQNAQWDVDFLLPDIQDNDIQMPLRPMDYATALYFLRRYIHCEWQRSDRMSGLDLNYTVHSLKATLLSWGPQISSFIQKEQRLQQGHHSDPNSSLETYSRDSVWGALEFQREVKRQIINGWRPHIAQHRGAQTPMVEPAVSLERFSKSIPSNSFRWFNFQAQVDPTVEQPVTSDTSTSSSSSEVDSDSDCELQAEPCKPATIDPLLPNDQADEVLIGKYRSVLHAMVKATDNFEWRPSYEGYRLKPACGRAMKASDTTILCRIEPSMQLCQHGACRKVWSKRQLSV